MHNNERLDQIRKNHAKWVEHFGDVNLQATDTRRDISDLLAIVDETRHQLMDAQMNLRETEKRLQSVAVDRDNLRERNNNLRAQLSIYESRGEM